MRMTAKTRRWYLALGRWTNQLECTKQMLLVKVLHEPISECLRKSSSFGTRQLILRPDTYLTRRRIIKYLDDNRKSFLQLNSLPFRLELRKEVKYLQDKKKRRSQVLARQEEKEEVNYLQDKNATDKLNYFLFIALLFWRFFRWGTLGSIRLSIGGLKPPSRYGW